MTLFTFLVFVNTRLHHLLEGCLTADDDFASVLYCYSCSSRMYDVDVSVELEPPNVEANL